MKKRLEQDTVCPIGLDHIKIVLILQAKHITNYMRIFKVYPKKSSCKRIYPGANILSRYNLNICLARKKRVECKLARFWKVLIIISTYFVYSKREIWSGSGNRAHRKAMRKGPKFRTRKAIALGKSFRQRPSKLIVNKVNR